MGDLLRLLSLIPGGTALIAWCNALLAMSFGQAILELGRLFFQFVGLWEFVKYVYRWIFRRRSRLEQQVEALEHRITERNQTIDDLRATRDRLTAELKAARDELPRAAIARAEREWRDLNQERAVRHLEDWFAENAGGIAAIARHLARYHIARSVPEPGDHLARARDMLRIARGAAPDDREAHELAGELDMVNAALQEQLIRDGERQIPWNSGMARFLSGQGEALLPLVTTLRDIADWCFEKGMWRLTPIFADRAVDLAQQAGRPLRRVWCQIAKDAAFYQLTVGHGAEALGRIDEVLSQAREFLALRDPVLLDARFVRAQVLSSLGRYGEALAEINAFAPIRVEVHGERNPATLTTRSLRAQVLSNLGRYGEALAEIDAFAPIRVEVQGERHPATLNTRYLRAQVLSNLGRYGEALAEIDAFAPIRVEVQGERHPATLNTRYLRAQVLSNLGRYGEALAEIDAFAPIRVEVHGERHPATLNTRSLRIGIEIADQRSVDRTAELSDITADLIAATGAGSRRTLRARYRLARLLFQQGRMAESRNEIADAIQHFDPATEPGDDLVRSARGLHDRIDGKPSDVALIV